MSLPGQTSFSALKVVESLTSEQLEYITEFSDQIESLRFLSRNLSGPPPTLDEAIEIVAVAPAALRKRKKREKPSYADKAWHAELGSEVTRKAKEGDRLPAVLSHNEVRMLLQAASHDQRDYLLLRLFYASAVRISEMENLLKTDLYLDELKVFIREGKGDKDRYVLIDPETARLLGEYTKDLGPQEKVFEIGKRQMARVVEKYAEKVGIIERYDAIQRNFTPHSLRHTAATHLYEAGMGLDIIGELLGHSILSVTLEYIHVGIGRRREVYQACHPLCQPPQILIWTDRVKPLPEV
jgi:integrase